MSEWSRREFLVGSVGSAGAAVLPAWACARDGRRAAVAAGAEGGSAGPSAPTGAPVAASGTARPAAGLAAGAPLLRKIPRSGEALPAIGMGTARTFDVGDAPEERRPLAEVLQLFFAGGGKVIDSSPMYGRAETVVGDLLAAGGHEGKAFLATKVWTEGRAEGVAQMEESMRRLRTRRLDLLQVHNLVDTETHLRTLRAWKDEGRIRYIGITHYQLGAFDELARVMRKHPLDFVQLPYSLGVREAEKVLLPLAAERGVAVLVMRPFEGGTLFREARAKPLPPVAAELGASSWAQLFLKFILAHPAVTCAIPATSKPEHMRDNLQAMRGPLPDEAQRKRLIEAVGA
jgi:aryl-alcohol dehydrogenase-like predicted oxidoreductase